MIEKTFTFYDGLDEEIFVYTWSPDYFNFNSIKTLDRNISEMKKIKGVIIISHGMAEHAKRYERFAKFLTDHDYIVFANDHRGHFKTAKTETPAVAKSLSSGGFFINSPIKLFLECPRKTGLPRDLNTSRFFIISRLS